MAITVFPSANGVGGAGQKVYSELNMAAWMQTAIPRNYIITGLDVSVAGTDWRIAPGAAVIAGHYVVVPDAILHTPTTYGSLLQQSLRLKLNRDALGNVNTVTTTTELATTVLTIDELELAYVVCKAQGQPPEVSAAMVQVYAAQPTPGTDIMSRVQDWSFYAESATGLTTTGTVSANANGYVQIATAAAVNATASASKYVPLGSTCPDFHRPQFMAVIAHLASETLYAHTEIWLIVGAPGIKKHVGFVMIDGEAYGTVGDGAAETRTSRLATSTSTFEGQVQFTPGENIVFRLGNATPAVIAANLPSGWPGSDSESAVMYASVKTTEAVAKTLQVSRWRWRQE